MKIKKQNDIEEFYNKSFRHTPDNLIYIKNYMEEIKLSLDDFKKYFPNYKIPKDPFHPKYDLRDQLYYTDLTEKGKEYGRLESFHVGTNGETSFGLELPWEDGEKYINAINKIKHLQNKNLFFNQKNKDNFGNDNKTKIKIECNIL